MKKLFLIIKSKGLFSRSLAIIGLFFAAIQSNLLAMANPYAEAPQKIAVASPLPGGYQVTQPGENAASRGDHIPQKNKSTVLPATHHVSNHYAHFHNKGKKKNIATLYQEQVASAPAGTAVGSPLAVGENYYSAVSTPYGQHSYAGPEGSTKNVILHPDMVTTTTVHKKKKKAPVVEKKLAPKKYDFSKEFSLFAREESLLSPEIARLIQDSDSAIKKLEQDLEQKESKLHVIAGQKLDGLQEKIEQEILAMRKSAEKIAFDLKEDIKQEALRLRQEAARRTFGIINKTEEEAFTLRREARLKDFEDRFGKIIEPKQTRFSKKVTGKKHRLSSNVAAPVSHKMEVAGERVSPEWKNDVSRKFYSDMAYMKKIILDGESPNEIHDYSQRFAEQNKWFDETMRAVRYVNDSNYSKIMHKQMRLQEVVAAQKRADESLKKMAHGLGLAVQQENKVRLMVLYDLNSLMQRRSQVSGALAALTTDEISSVVKRTLEEFSVKFQERSGRFPDVKILDNKTTQVVPVMAQKLQEELDAVQLKLEEAEQKIIQEQQNRKKLKLAAKQKLQEKAKGYLELEVKAQHAEQTKNRVLQMAKIDRDAKNVMTKRLEQIDKESMDLEVDLRKAKSEVELVKNAAVRELQHELAGKLEEKEKSNLELTSLLKRVTERADFFKQRAVDLVGETNILQEKIDLADQASKEAKAAAIQQLKLREEAEAKSLMAQDLAQQTIDSISGYLQEQRDSLTQVKKSLKVREEKLSTSEKSLLQDRMLVKRERDELLAHKKLLSKEQRLLEGLQKETKRLVENSVKMSDESMVEFLKLRKDSEFELRKMQDDMKRELHFVREELKRIKSEGKEELSYARNKLDKINDDIKGALQEQNLLSMQRQLEEKELEDERSHEQSEREHMAITRTQQEAPPRSDSVSSMPNVQAATLSATAQTVPKKIVPMHKESGMPGVVLKKNVMPGIDPQKL